MMDEKLKGWALSFCGLNCAKCDMYAAGHGDEKLRNEIIAWFKEKRNLTLKPEQIKCEGCRGPLDAHWSADCKMMLCAKKKGVQYCFECADFPCNVLNKFASDGAAHHKKTVEMKGRYEFHGKGKELYKAVIEAQHVMPKGFVDVSAEEFLKHPEKYGFEGEWTDREVES